MDNGIMIIDGLDQSLPTESGTDWLFEQIDKIINTSVEQKNAEIAFSACRQMIDISKLSGMGLAKALYMIRSNWDRYDLDDDFEDLAFDRLGLRSETISRYSRVWAMHVEGQIPEQFAESIQQRNIKDQIPIASAISQGYEFSERDWEEFAHAPDYATVSRKLREIKGTAPRKNSLQITLKRDGTLVAMHNDNQVFVGYLNVKEKSDTTLRAVERIVNNAGILKDW